MGQQQPKKKDTWREKRAEEMEKFFVLLSGDNFPFPLFVENPP